MLFSLPYSNILTKGHKSYLICQRLQIRILWDEAASLYMFQYQRSFTQAFFLCSHMQIFMSAFNHSKKKYLYSSIQRDTKNCMNTRHTHTHFRQENTCVQSSIQSYRPAVLGRRLLKQGAEQDLQLEVAAHWAKQ